MKPLAQIDHRSITARWVSWVRWPSILHQPAPRHRWS